MSDNAPTVNISAKDIPWGAAMLLRKGIISALPLGAHLRIGSVRGRITKATSSPPDAVRENIRSAFEGQMTDSEMDRIAIEHQSYRKQIYLWRLLPTHPLFGSREWPVSGLERLEEAVALGNGVILVTAHLGFPHFIPPVLYTYGHEVRQVIAEVDRLEKQRRRQDRLKRASRFRRLIDTHTRTRLDSIGPRDFVAGFDIRPIRKALLNGETVMVAGDGLRSTSFLQLRLLGVPHPFSPGFIKIALMTGAQVLPAFAVLGEDGIEIRVEIQEALPIRDSLSIEDNLGLFVNVLERQLLKTPHLWQRWNIPDWFQHANDWAAKAMSIDPYTVRREVVVPARVHTGQSI